MPLQAFMPDFGFGYSYSCPEASYLTNGQAGV